MEHTWRWYGPKDSVSLNDIRQAGATNVVTALHHIANGEIWPEDEILQRKQLIEESSLTWTIVESVPVHEDIKRQTGNFQQYIDNYKQTIINLAKHGVKTICYNFMPVLDWTRTDLSYELPDGSRALRFDQIAFAAFDMFILKRKDSSADYSKGEQQQALEYFNKMSEQQRKQLTDNIIAGLPGSEEGYNLEDFQSQLDAYKNINKETFRSHLAYFLSQIIDTCSAVGMHLAIHPDDPPKPLLGLPRIMSTIDDVNWLTKKIPNIHNGITMCTGSYGVRSDNDLVHMIKTHGNRIYFAHLRSTQREDNPNNFYEASHLAGDVDMYSVVYEILKQENMRKNSGQQFNIPIRPDHGHQILDDLKKVTNPGYSAIGRLKGLAEIRGLETAINRIFFNKP